MTDVAGGAAPTPAPSAEAAPAPTPAPIVGSATPPAEGAPPVPAPAPSGPDALYPTAEGDPPKVPDPAGVDPSTSPTEGEPTTPAPLTPESYTDLKFRDGMSPSADRLKSFTELAAKANLQPSDAQALIDLQQDIATEQGEAFRNSQLQSFKDTQSAWQAESMKLPWLAESPDPKTNPGLQAIGTLFDEFDKTGEFRAMLDQTGVGNHPATLAFLHDVVQTIVEGAPTSPGRPIPSGPNGKARASTPAEALYPST